MNLLLNQENVLFNSIYSEFKRNLSAKNTPLGYSLTSWMWQPCQGKSTREFAENTLPEFAKKTRQSPSFGRRKKTHRHWKRDIFSTACWLRWCWFSTTFRCSHKPWKWDFRNGIRLRFPSRGDSGMFFYIYIYLNPAMSYYSAFFFIGEGGGWVKRDVSVAENGEEKKKIPITPIAPPLAASPLFFSPFCLSLPSHPPTFSPQTRAPDNPVSPHQRKDERKTDGEKKKSGRISGRRISGR